MRLPKNIQWVMLSATIDSPEKFALWCEKISPTKKVYLSSTTERVVPLIHYAFTSYSQSIFKMLRGNKEQIAVIKHSMNKLHILKEGIEFKQNNYENLNRLQYQIKTECPYYRSSRPFILNQITQYLVENEMLPAICFVLSRRAVEQMAEEVNTVLLEDDSKIRYLVHTECEQLLRKKLPNFEEYMRLPEYQHLISLMEKGIAIHHAGILPIFREIVELRFSQGKIKLLFATETFSVGINMPTKTVLMTDITKYDGHQHRLFMPHEYTQMAGRAGRRGIDTVGHIIHLTNLYREGIPEMMDLKNLMGGVPQKLISRLIINDELIFHILASISVENIKNMDTVKYCYEYLKTSMYAQNIIEHLSMLSNKYTEQSIILQQMQTAISSNKTENINQYKQLLNTVKLAETAKQRKPKRIMDAKYNYTEFMQENPTIHIHIEQQIALDTMQQIVEKLYEEYNDYNKQIEFIKKENIKETIELTEKQNNIIKEEIIKENIDIFRLTEKGQIAVFIHELPAAMTVELMPLLKNMNSQDIAIFLSCFTNISVPEDLQCAYNVPTELSKQVIECMKNAYEYITIQTPEINPENIIQYDLSVYINLWWLATNENECRQIITLMEQEKKIYLGEFVKAVLKIVAIALNLEIVANHQGYIAMLVELQKIPEKLLKYVVINQSLYV